MEIIVYFLIFIIGALFGSFFSLAVYRIPIKQSIMYGRSYCPKCNHKLKFLDLVPVLSYIFLGGKCRYCKEKIRPRYILLETICGIVFLLFTISLRINIYSIEINKLVYLLFGIIYISTLFIIGGIEKENHLIQNSVFLFGFIINSIYMIYLYIIGISIYKYVIYLFFILIILLINTLILKKKGKESYTLQIIMLCFYFVNYEREETVIFSIIISILFVILKELSTLKKHKKDNKKGIIKNDYNKVIPIGYYLCATNVIGIILQNYIIYK